MGLGLPAAIGAKAARPGATVSTGKELDDALVAAIEAERTFIVDMRVDPRAECYPMIVPGGAVAEQVEWSEVGL